MSYNTFYYYFRLCYAFRQTFFINFKRIITDATKFSDDPILFPKTLQIIKKGKFLEVDYDGTFVIKPIKGGSSVGVNIIKKGNKIPYLNELNNKQLMAEIFGVGSSQISLNLKKTSSKKRKISNKNISNYKYY